MLEVTNALGLDPTGTNPDNRRMNEVHKSQGVIKLIVPEYNPYFLNSLSVYKGNRRLTKGIEWRPTDLALEATTKYAKEIYTAIILPDNQEPGDITINYQALGGEGRYNIAALKRNQILIDNDERRGVHWRNVEAKPSLYPAEKHLHILDDIYDFSVIDDYIERIKTSIQTSKTEAYIAVLRNLMPKYKYISEEDVKFNRPSRKIVTYDVLLYLLSKAKILSEISVDAEYYDWEKGSTNTIMIDTTELPTGVELKWELYAPEGWNVYGPPAPVALQNFFTTVSGAITTNSTAIREIPITVRPLTTTPAESLRFDTYVGVTIQDGRDSSGYDAVSFRININP